MQVLADITIHLAELQSAVKAKTGDNYATAGTNLQLGNRGDIEAEWWVYTSKTDILRSGNKDGLLARISDFDPDIHKANRIAELKAELAKLEGV